MDSSKFPSKRSLREFVAENSTAGGELGLIVQKQPSPARTPSVPIWDPVLGAHLIEGGVRYTVWAPGAKSIEVEVGFEDAIKRFIPLIQNSDGYYRGVDPLGKAGDAYKFRIDGDISVPDPASRGQTGDVHESSQVMDSSEYSWEDEQWERPPFRDLVIYEIHVGTFTEEGTFEALATKLPYLADLGVNAIELMPIADFPGSRNWGYDGVLIYAPERRYGTPDDLRRLVDAAHRHGIAVILDVVYNHLGPDGNYIGHLSERFYHERHQTPWGSAFNLDGNESAPVRYFFTQNPIYWMQEFHIDGYRLDATHAIVDESKQHIFDVITEAIHRRGGYAIAEDERNEQRMLLSVGEGGHGFDAVWADDFHHSIRVSQTRESVAYFSDFTGSEEEVLDTLANGWLFRGQVSRHAGKERGTECSHLSPSHFIHCISNHDQAGNRAFGERLHTAISPASYRLLSMILCLTPYTPMLFMGQEWAASSPFLYFTDHNPELGELIKQGRRKEFRGFPGFDNEESLQTIPDPQAEETFLKSKLVWEENQKTGHAGTLRLYQTLIALRREHKAFRPADRQSWQPMLLSSGVAALQFTQAEELFLLVFNLSGNRQATLSTEPSMKKLQWQYLLSSEEERFEGSGNRFFDGRDLCEFAGPGAVLLTARH